MRVSEEGVGNEARHLKTVPLMPRNTVAGSLCRPEAMQFV